VLTKIFAIEVIAYAAMSNHLHSLIRTRPEVAKEWTAEEVASRWLKLFPKTWRRKGLREPSEEEITAITNLPEKVELYRKRLCSISWFNRCLNENIARRANLEDDCTGRFWEGRFQCQRVYDVAGIVACSAYIDLNPIRAKLTDTLESSDHTSVQDRIHERIHERTGKKPARAKKWPKVPLVSIPDATENQLTLDEYLKIVDETGRQLLPNKRGAISPDIAPILDRLQIAPEEWDSTLDTLRRSFKRVLGPEPLIQKAARNAKRSWFHGISTARKFFQQADKRKA